MAGFDIDLPDRERVNCLFSQVTFIRNRTKAWKTCDYWTLSMVMGVTDGFEGEHGLASEDRTNTCFHIYIYK